MPYLNFTISLKIGWLPLNTTNYWKLFWHPWVCNMRFCFLLYIFLLDFFLNLTRTSLGTLLMVTGQVMVSSKLIVLFKIQVNTKFSHFIVYDWMQWRPFDGTRCNWSSKNCIQKISSVIAPPPPLKAVYNY